MSHGALGPAASAAPAFLRGKYMEGAARFASLAELPCDGNDHLVDHWLLTPAECAATLPPFHFDEPRHGTAAGDLARALGLDGCPSAAYVPRGVARSLTAAASKKWSSGGKDPSWTSVRTAAGPEDPATIHL